MEKKIKLNIKFKGNEIVCAKSPLHCKDCLDNNTCEEIVMHYYPFDKREVEECFKNDERHRWDYGKSKI